MRKTRVPLEASRAFPRPLSLLSEERCLSFFAWLPTQLSGLLLCYRLRDSASPFFLPKMIADLFASEFPRKPRDSSAREGLLRDTRSRGVSLCLIRTREKRRRKREKERRLVKSHGRKHEERAHLLRRTASWAWRENMPSQCWSNYTTIIAGELYN